MMSTAKHIASLETKAPPRERERERERGGGEGGDTHNRIDTSTTTHCNPWNLGFVVKSRTVTKKKNKKHRKRETNRVCV